MRTGPLGCDYYVKDIDFRKVKLEIVPSLIAIISDTTQLLYEHRPYASSFIETISKGEVCARYVEKIIDPSFAALRIIDVEKGTYISIADLEVIANLYSQKWEEVKGLSRRKIRRVWRQNPPLSHSTFRWSVD